MEQDVRGQGLQMGIAGRRDCWRGVPVLDNVGDNTACSDTTERRKGVDTALLELIERLIELEIDAERDE